MKALGDAADGEAARSTQDTPPARPGRGGRSGEGAGSALEHLLRQENARVLERRNREAAGDSDAKP